MPSRSTAAEVLVLASGSPRRRELLNRAGLRFEVRPADIPERTREGESPEDLVTRLAEEKALAVTHRLETGAPRWVLGADTVVVLDADVLGKPTSPDHAVVLLGRLVGRTHRVLTGVAMVDGRTQRVLSLCVESRVRMRSADKQEIRDYVSGGEPLDKAGGYALQGEGRRFVESVEGSESNVIGLPMEETLELIARAQRAGDSAGA